MSSALSEMQKCLYKVLGCMDINEDSKVLIAMKLKTDKQIYDFLRFIKDEVPEQSVKPREDEIVNKAVDIGNDENATN